jgi:hypothetical protein
MKEVYERAGLRPIDEKSDKEGDGNSGGEDDDEGDDEWPDGDFWVTWSYTDNEITFLSPLGTANGSGVAHMAADFSGQLKGKNVVKVHNNLGKFKSAVVWELA